MIDVTKVELPCRFCSEWQSVDEQLEKVEEELEETRSALEDYRERMTGRNREALAEEIADVVMASANLALVAGIDLREELEKCFKRNLGRGRYE